MSKRKCVHIIIRDKFTSGYINFFKLNDFDWEHIFYTFSGNYSLDINDDKNVFVVNNYKEIINNYDNTLNECQKIVVAAFFDEAVALLQMPKKYWNKTYIQFWGGDIYRFKDIRKDFVSRIKQLIMKSLVSKCIKLSAGVLTLVEGDYQEIENVFKVKKEKHHVVQVPDDFYELNHIDYKSIIEKTDKTDTKRILVGNSATEENGHLEIFDILKNKCLNNCQILVPLSYGNDEYKNLVINKGKELFNDLFIPVTDFMPREKYISLLSTCDVAIFNNNRQQATGNIILLANLGKKLYLRNDTSMWPFFLNLGFSLHDIADLKNESIEQILDYSAKEKENNYSSLRRMENEAIDQWNIFLNK